MAASSGDDVEATAKQIEEIAKALMELSTETLEKLAACIDDATKCVDLSNHLNGGQATAQTPAATQNVSNLNDKGA